MAYTTAGTPKLQADFDAGEGKVKFPADWREWDGLMRADLLKDWIRFLEVAYDEAVSDMRTEQAEIAVEASLRPTAQVVDLAAVKFVKEITSTEGR